MAQTMQLQDLLPWAIVLLIVLYAVLIVIMLFRRPRNRDEGNSRRNEVEAGSIRQEIMSMHKDARDDFSKFRQEILASSAANSKSLKDVLDLQSQSRNETLRELSDTVRKSSAAEQLRFDELKKSVEEKLSEVKSTVDEQLQEALDKKLTESFSLVSKQLESVHQGLGDMRELASGVGDLKRILANVKTRGTWGEMQLGVLLEQILDGSQYATNVATLPGSSATVEYAIRLPGKGSEPDSVVWLPIDAKFPIADYERLANAFDSGQAEEVRRCRDQLRRTVEASAKTISEKYVGPPHTTDFAIMYLPTEGLYAEVVRTEDMISNLQNKYRIVAAGPSTLAALLNSLQIGFRTLAIEKRTSEVWALLADVKTEFGKFGDHLEIIRKQLNTVINTLSRTDTRFRVIQRKIRDVHEDPDLQSQDKPTARLLEMSDKPDVN